MTSFTKRLAKLTLVEKKAAYKEAKAQYYNAGNSELTDAEFDALEDSIRTEAPNWAGLKATGIKAERIGKKSEVDLTVPMPSLDKLQAGNPVKLNRWLTTSISEAHVVVSEKLDGSSVQGEYHYGKLVRLTTRGDGVVGKGVNYFIPHVNLPAMVKGFKAKSLVVIRFEAVMKRKTYAKKWAGEYDSARALASSLLNRQDVAPALADLDFVALRVLRPLVPLSEGLDMISIQGFNTTKYDVCFTSRLTDGFLTKRLATVRQTSEYETDGLVIHSDEAGLTVTGDRPKYARAYKVNDEDSAPVTRIVRIQWQPSQFGVLVPKAIIEPVKFGGVTVKQAALHNAKWAIERGCGVGAVVKVLRSGDIIPKIVSVETPEDFVLPKTSEFGKFVWDATRTNIVLVAGR